MYDVEKSILIRIVYFKNANNHSIKPKSKFHHDDNPIKIRMNLTLGANALVMSIFLSPTQRLWFLLKKFYRTINA